ncbi:ap-3 adaptor complex subunit mu [Diplodia corticola]|uniref:Ap-3 adaptor complex subunit mu n=1 Tax=Diplodia corticola TaxID=236234 RepID=A0A1J9R1L1_9PEZI|nr:ap-3 adaptor complex subunit mu [Diplodia corticola]OJD34130.1 ap-3 adaptor complex subunit mu [Diplodia corticola]
MSQVEALYIFDEHNNLILEHVYCARPPAALHLLPLYLQHPAPRPSLVYLPSTNPPTLVHSIIQDRLLFLAPSSVDTEPLLVLEFLHRVADAIEDFLGSPLLATKIEAHYDVVAQLLGEMCDAGIVANTEANALRDLVEAPSVMKNLLGNMGLPSYAPPHPLPPQSHADTPRPASSSSPALNPASTFGRPSLKPTLTPPGSSPTASPVPWRRANVRHTSNELYVDAVETLSVTFSPSGAPISAFANGSIAFTSKVSGIPDLILRLDAPGGIAHVVQLPVFHPCVRLARWRERPGELSFVPPDGRFVLAGYEVDLLGPGFLLDAQNLKQGTNRPALNIPANVEVKTNLGPAGADFEVRLSLSPRFRSTASSSSGSGGGGASGRPGGGLGSRTGSGFAGLGGGGGGHSGTSAAPQLSDVTVRVPLPAGVRNLADVRPSRGEVTQYAPGDGALEWRVSSKDVAALLQLGMGAVATLRCSVVGGGGGGSLDGDDEADGEGDGAAALVLGGGRYDYDEVDGSASGSGGGYQSGGVVEKANGTGAAPDVDARAERRRQANRLLMPSSAALSFQVKGWLASGVKVESLNLDQRKSRGLGAGVTPYKGVKYLTVSRDGVEVRC